MDVLVSYVDQLINCIHLNIVALLKKTVKGELVITFTDDRDIVTFVVVAAGV